MVPAKEETFKRLVWVRRRQRNGRNEDDEKVKDWGEERLKWLQIGRGKGEGLTFMALGWEDAKRDREEMKPLMLA